MKVFVTGGTGFVGGHVIDALLDDGHDIIVMTRHVSKLERLSNKGVYVVEGDSFDRDEVKHVLADVDAVVHLIGIIVETKGEGSFEQVHYIGTKNVVDAARLAAVKKFVQMSALGAEEGAASEYHKSKYKAEEYVKTCGLNYTIFKPSVIYGAGDAFVNMYANMLKISPLLPIIGNGAVKMQPVYVKDIAKMFSSALTGPLHSMMTYEVGGPEQLTFDEIVETVARVMGKKTLKVHLPLWFMKINAALMELVLKKPPICRDQLLMLEKDNVCDVTKIREAFFSKGSIGLTSYENGVREMLSES